MSHASFASAFNAHEAQARERILQETFGHLAPEENKEYRGFVVFAIGCCGSDHLNPTPLEIEFGDLDSSPWLFDSLIEMLQGLQTTEGGVYRWEGRFRNYKWSGRMRRLKLVAPKRK